jgi:hypothetical protein
MPSILPHVAKPKNHIVVPKVNLITDVERVVGFQKIEAWIVALGRDPPVEGSLPHQLRLVGHGWSRTTACLPIYLTPIVSGPFTALDAPTLMRWYFFDALILVRGSKLELNPHAVKRVSSRLPPTQNTPLT